jgi:hypothetical protein
VFLARYNEPMAAHDRRTGAVRWRWEDGLPVVWVMADDDGLVIPRPSAALTLRDHAGAPRWSLPAEHEVFAFGSTLALARHQRAGAAVLLLDRATGTTLAELPRPERHGDDFVFAQDVVYAASRAGVEAFDREGKALWRLPADELPASRPVGIMPLPEAIVLYHEDGTFLCFGA